MILSDISVKRPVFASVLSLLLLAFGLVAFDRLPLREYPDIDPPVISIETNYPGAAANIVETRITEVIEERVAGVAGIKFISSSSQDGKSDITIEFKTGYDINEAANDIRDRISRIADNLPEESDPPEIQKVDSGEDVIVWLNLAGEGMSVPELTDYADRYLVDRFSVIDGVARVQIGGRQDYAIRVWIDRNELAARNLTVNDVENVLRAENVELPAGDIESSTRQFTLRVERSFMTPEDFSSLVLYEGAEGDLIRLGDVARVEKSTVENRTTFRGNTVAMVGIGIVKQSTANTIEVARLAREEAKRINETLPKGMVIKESFDSSVFIEGAIKEVYTTLFIAIILVVLVIYLFLGNVRATIIPAVTVPVSIIATFLVLLVCGYSVNILTLLALVLAIGIVVDDAIVMLENIVRRIQEENEPPLLAAYNGARQVGFAVVATTLVLIAVFVPISFAEGDVGRLFSEFAITIAAAVGFSSIVALTLCPMLASKILKEKNDGNAMTRFIDNGFLRIRGSYGRLVGTLLRRWPIVAILFIGLIGATVWMGQTIEQEYAPKEDRGAFFIRVDGPEGASFSYMEDYMNEIEARLMPYVERNEISRLLVRAPRGFGNIASFNTGIVIVVLNDWSERRNGFEIMNEIRGKLSDLPGVRAFPIMRQGFKTSATKPVQFVIGGASYEQLTEWRNILDAKLAQDNPGLIGIDWDYKETKPQLQISIDYERAAELGVSVRNIGRTMETMLGGRAITTFIENGKEYDVMVEGERDAQRTPTNIENIYVRSERSGALIPLSNMITINERAAPESLNRYNRVRALTLEADLADGYSLGEALKFLETTVRETLPAGAVIDYKGLSRDYKYTGGSIAFIFILGLFITFLVLAAQFESYVHPFVIMLTVPLAIAGGLAGLYATGATLNIYSQIGLIMLVGLSAKNGILIVEFANQLRDQGHEFMDALIEASQTRLRPIMMTGITTAAGSIPLLLSSGPGSETRAVIGTVIMAGVLSATFFTLFVVPVAYGLLTRGTGSPGDQARRIAAQQAAKDAGQDAVETL